MNENIKKFEYYTFFNIIKEKIFIKNNIKANIIIFQKRCALEELLTNVIFQMKDSILKEKLKKFLIKKFIYQVKKKHIEDYKEINSFENKKDKISFDSLKNKKAILNKFFLKAYMNLFKNRANTCINNTKLKIILNGYTKEKGKNQIKYFFKEIRQFKHNKIIKAEKIFLQKKFFNEIKIIKIYKSKQINIINELNSTQKTIILKMNFITFIKNCKLISKSNKNKNIINQKLENYEANEKIKEIRKKIKKKYLKRFIKRTKVIKQTNDNLKRKIFNLIKNNAKLSKDLNYYLNEANEIG